MIFVHLFASLRENFGDVKIQTDIKSVIKFILNNLSANLKIIKYFPKIGIKFFWNSSEIAVN